MNYQYKIKFKARNAELPRCWVYGYFVKVNGNCAIFNDDREFKVIAGSKCQFTGFYDDLGHEIYDKDYIRVMDSNIFNEEVDLQVNMQPENYPGTVMGIAYKEDDDSDNHCSLGDLLCSKVLRVGDKYSHLGLNKETV